MKRLKGKRWVFLSLFFALVIFLYIPPTAFAQDTQLTTIVPSQFLLKIELDGKGEVQIGEKHFSTSTTISVNRHTETEIALIPAENYEIKSVLYNGKLLTGDLRNDILTLPELTGDSVLIIAFTEKVSPPQTGQKQYWLLPCMIGMIFSGMMIVWLKAKKVIIH